MDRNASTAAPQGRSRSTRRRALALPLALALALPAAALAQAWPAKPIRMIVSTSAGTAPDIIARLVADKLDKSLNQRFLVDNRPVAQGVVAVDQLKRSPADGYTIALLQAAAAVVTPYTYKGANYDIERDLDTIAMVAYSPMLFVATPKGGARTLAELVAAGKSKPGAIALGNPTRASIPHIAGELLGQRTGARYQQVSFNGTTKAVQALLAGDIDFYVDGAPPLLPFVKSGKMIALAVAADRQLPGFEGIPLAKETIPDFVVNGWFVIVAPKGLPPAILARLNTEINAALALPDVVQRFADLGTYPMTGSAEEAARFVRSEKALFSKALAEAGVQPE